MKLTRIIMLLIAAAGCVGCSSMRPGKMEWVSPVSTAPRAGNVYLLRGWIGVFSTGIDQLTEQLNTQGVRANVYQDDQWRTLANTIKEKYKGGNAEPVVLVGHSYGADDVVRIAQVLNSGGVPVDLLITLDPVTPPNVPGNVKTCVNLYQTNGIADALPFLRGVKLEKEKGAPTVLVNSNIRKERSDLLEPGTDHFNIEKKAKIHGEVIKQVLAICPPRASWVAMHRNAPNPNAVAKTSSSEPAKPLAASEQFDTMGN